MSVYVLAQLRFKDRARYQQYQQRFMSVLQKFAGARLLVADEAPEPLEGSWQYDKLVLLSFPDTATFRAWNQSPEYQQILVDRQAGAEAVALLAHGVG
jgi:uncharacterized protein (DUF1330 family)